MRRPEHLRPHERALIWAVLLAWSMLCYAALFAAVAHAQIGGDIFSERESVRPHGKFIVGWNTTGSQIADGTLVMADTTGTTSQPQVAIGKGFKTWSGVVTDSRLILGVLIGNTASYAQGRILVLGFHPNVKLAATAVAARSLLRASLTVTGAMAERAAADSANQWKAPIGILQRYSSPDSLRGYVWVNTTGIMGGAR